MPYVNRRTRPLPRQRSFEQTDILQWRASIYEQNLRAVPCPSRRPLELLIRGIKSQDDNGSEEETASATPNKIFQILNQTIEVLSTVPVPDLALRLYLECAEAANDCDLEPVAYEFFTQAYILYEEEISDSKAHVTALYLIIGTLQRMHVFGVEKRDTLTHKATGYSAKLLKKPDQRRAVYACSHLFWVDDQDGIKDDEMSYN